MEALEAASKLGRMGVVLWWPGQSGPSTCRNGESRRAANRREASEASAVHFANRRTEPHEGKAQDEELMPNATLSSVVTSVSVIANVDGGALSNGTSTRTYSASPAGGPGGPGGPSGMPAGLAGLASLARPHQGPKKKPYGGHGSSASGGLGGPAAPPATVGSPAGLMSPDRYQILFRRASSLVQSARSRARQEKGKGGGGSRIKRREPQ